MQFLTAIVLFSPLISALVFDAPAATPIILGLQQALNPKPTEAPNVNELLKRQVDSGLTLIEGPDDICGYQFGSSGKLSNS